ncbi:hypothetical protein [Parablautia sp. Marseille-Q6255]|nr:hypothetical protein [Parablautia sp. Marseille-Q6255]
MVRTVRQERDGAVRREQEGAGKLQAGKKRCRQETMQARNDAGRNDAA